MKEKFNINSTNNENGKHESYLDQTEHYLAHSKIFAKFSFTMVLIGFLGSTMFFDLNYFAETTYVSFTPLKFSFYLLTLIQVSSGFAVISIILRRFFLHKYRQMSREGGDIFHRSHDFKIMIFEILIIIIVPADYFNQITINAFNTERNIFTMYTLNDIILLVMFFRIYLLLELFLRNTEYSSFKMKKYLKLSKQEDNLIFIMKCLISTYPYLFFAFSFSTSLCIFSYLIRVCELPLSVTDSDISYQSYLNATWMVMITMTTVGYSDNTPKTIPGRIITFFMIIWGIYSMSLIIIILFQSLELNSHERLSLIIFNKLELKKLMYKKAAEVISERWLFKIQKEKKEDKFFKALIEFREIQKEIRVLDNTQSDNFYQKMNFFYENMEESVQELSALHQKVHRFRKSLAKASHLRRRTFKKNDIRDFEFNN